MFKRIVGIVMVKNEDLYIEAVLRAIKSFCDEIVVIDTGSTDETVELVKEQGIVPIEEPDLRRTHEYIQPYVGKEGVWLFGVDGDEIYDASRLWRLRHQLEDGLYNEFPQVQGWYLHVTGIDGNHARGFLGPPSHTPTKLYNMGKIPRWEPDGKHILFQARGRRMLGEKTRALPDTWEKTPLRCVHMRFFPRSTEEPEETIGARLHGEDVLGHGNRSDRGGRDDRNERLMYKRGGERDVEIWHFA